VNTPLLYHYGKRYSSIAEVGLQKGDDGQHLLLVMYVTVAWWNMS
jgi:hypothetical protein